LEHYGIWSLLPPVVAIALAIKTRQVFLSLLFGIWFGWLVLSDWNFVTGSVATIQALVDVFKSAGNTRTIMFSALVGALIAFIQNSGGVEGFIRQINVKLEKLTHDGKRNPSTIIQIFAWLTGVIIFVESSITVLTVGSIFRPLFDRYKISREKLAFIADSTSAPVCILIPLNAWGAFIMGLLLTQGFTDPLKILLEAYPLNFYPIITLFGVLVIILSKKDFGPMKKAQRRVKVEGKLLADNARPMISDELSSIVTKPGVKPAAINMILPIALMVGMMPIILIFDGWSAVENKDILNTMQILFQAIGKGSGSTAVLLSVLIALSVAAITYRIKGIFKTQEILDLTFKGIGGLMPLALLMMLAFAIGAVSKKLGAGLYIAEITKSWLSPGFVPLILFLVSSFIAFSTGTSWGTFAIMMAIAIPMTLSMQGSVPMSVAAVLGGGIFGDHCSPISDTTIISSMASACDHIDHVKTQLPYALFFGGLSALLYLIIGLLS